MNARQNHSVDAHNTSIEPRKPRKPVPAGYYRSPLHTDMIFKKRSACDTIEAETPQVPLSELTLDPYASEGRKLAIEERGRRARAIRTGDYSDYFEWRQSIGNDYYDEIDRLMRRVAANDNHAANCTVAA